MSGDQNVNKQDRPEAVRGWMDRLIMWLDWLESTTNAWCVWLWLANSQFTEKAAFKTTVAKLEIVKKSIKSTEISTDSN